LPIGTLILIACGFVQTRFLLWQFWY